MKMKQVGNTVFAALIAVGFSAITSVAASDDAGQDYIVRAGDSLARISARFYEDPHAYPTIIEGNNHKAETDTSYAVIHTPDEIHPGQKLWIPSMASIEADKKEGHGEHAAHWAYQGEGGPTHWGDLDENFAACGTGRRQSPVSIPHDAAATTANLSFAYKPTHLNVVNNGHTIQVNYDPGSTLSVDGKTFEVAQFHFHSPSENTVDGVAAALEMHIVHVADDGALAVIAVLFDISEADNPFLATFWNVFPDSGHEVGLSDEANVAGAFDIDGGKTSFAGSLTTPPCSEGVNWFISIRHETLSKRQLGEFVSLIGLNARPTQPINGRVFGEF